MPKSVLGYIGIQKTYIAIYLAIHLVHVSVFLSITVLSSLFVLILYVLVNNFSVMSGQVFLG